ncbi:MAG: biotin-dependent carboxyltransferase family protein [Clostridiaceae bacterium]|nr:biotin-dependent carboxyltransferase family protein [Clostridiaceae bacterium]
MKGWLMMIKVLSPGLLTTVQDGGRYGWQQYGVPVCGAMDIFSMNLANIIVGNKENEAVLEITAMGPRLEFETNGVFAICGGVFDSKLDNLPLRNAKAYTAIKGNVLEIGAVKEGFRAYLAIGGGFDLEPVLGSAATYIKGGFGGFKGRRLQRDDLLPLRHEAGWLPFMESRQADELIWRYPLSDKPVRVVVGPQLERFSKKGIETFLSCGYKIAAESDRMGYRLDGERIEYQNGMDGNIISDGIVMGAVQVSAGRPMIMMADRQTTGGYAKIATVISSDLPLLGQKKPGDTVRFEAVEPSEAVTIYKKYRRRLERVDFYR